MSRFACSVFALTILASLPNRAAAQSYVVDPAHTSVVFSVGHSGFSYTYGLFREASGSVAFDPADPMKSRFQLAVAVDSINTGNKARDAHLLNPDFFDAAKYPQITFVGSPVSVTKDKQGRNVYQVAGKLTMHGVTREVTLPIKLLGTGKDHQGKQRIGFHCGTAVKRSDYGMAKSLGPISDSIGVTFSFEAVQK